MNLPAGAAVYTAFGLWCVLGFCLIAYRHTPRTAAASWIAAWLFLPPATIRFPFFFYTTKAIVIALVLLVAVCIWDFPRVRRFRPHWLDLPVGLFCLVPLVSALANGVELPDAVRLTLDHVCVWGVPYFMGRLYLTDLSALRELAMGVVIGGVVYIPLCWYEILFGPNLHVLLYGFPPSPLEMAVRFGGWRPIVFQLHGLMVGLYMAEATVCAFWLWRTNAVPALGRIPMLWIFLALAVTTGGVKSVNGWVLASLGILFLWMASRVSPAGLVAALAAVVMVYLAVRITGVWNAGELAAVGQLIEGKKLSAYYRVTFETLIAARSRVTWLWGWGTNDRAMVRDYLGRIQTISDSYWIALYGMWGLAGLTAWLTTVFAPILVLCKAFSMRRWSDAGFAPAAVLATGVLLYLLDGLLNTMPNPIYALALGGLVSVCLQARGAQVPGAIVRAQARAQESVA